MAKSTLKPVTYKGFTIQFKKTSQGHVLAKVPKINKGQFGFGDKAHALKEMKRVISEKVKRGKPWTPVRPRTPAMEELMAKEGTWDYRVK